jgi:hypothetical protein
MRQLCIEVERDGEEDEPYIESKEADAGFGLNEPPKVITLQLLNTRASYRYGPISDTPGCTSGVETLAGHEIPRSLPLNLERSGSIICQYNIETASREERPETTVEGALAG